MEEFARLLERFVAATGVWRIAAIVAPLLLAGCDGDGKPTGCERIDRGVLPEWARAGFSDPQPKAPHVIARAGTIVAILFGDPLSSPPDAKRSNRILWVARRTPALGDLKITAGQRSRTVTRVVARGQGPSIIDLPAAGCWQLTLRWAGPDRHDGSGLLLARYQAVVTVASGRGASSRTTGTTKAWETGRRRMVVARTVMGVKGGQWDLRERSI